MSMRKMTKAEWAAFLSGDREEGRRGIMGEHIEKSPGWQAESAAIERLLKETEAVKAEIREAAASVNWDTLPAMIADRALAADVQARRNVAASPRWGWLAAFPLKPVLAGLAAGLVVGAAAMYFTLKAPGVRRGQDNAYYASGDFLDRAELEMARRNTLDYLEKSQYVLLDVFESADEGPVVPPALRSERARDLLQKKKYLNAQLETFQMAKAKVICDQIETLFLELSQLEGDLPAAELGKIRSFIEDRQLLLKINLVRKELQSGV